MTDIVKLVTTSVIWGTLAIIFTINGPFSGEMVPLAVVLGIGATISTGMIWQGQNNRKSETAQATKAKRSNRISRLMDTLDEDELDDLQAWMEARRDQRLTDDELLSRSR